jgi:hypothetical protein
MEASSEVAPRGVYKALYNVKGRAVLVAIDSKGDARKHLKIERGEEEPQLKRALEEFLDMVDPLPGPQLVREEAGPGWPYDRSTPPPPVRPSFTSSRRRRK